MRQLANAARIAMRAGSEKRMRDKIEMQIMEKMQNAVVFFFAIVSENVFASPDVFALGKVATARAESRRSMMKTGKKPSKLRFSKTHEK